MYTDHGTLWLARHYPRSAAITAGAVVFALVGTAWLMLQAEARSPSPAGVIGEDEEIPPDVPELPADITYEERSDVVPSMVRLDPETTADLEQSFQTLDYQWPPTGGVPAVSVGAFPPLEEISVAERKALFFRTLLPLLLAENRIMLATRAQLQAIFEAGDVEPETREARVLNTLAERFRVDGDPNSQAFRDTLLRRVDAVPPSMAMAQAANETGWGRSRFAKEANNLFGVWTWDPEHGLRPERRAEGASHFVRVFPDLRASVRNYLYTINIGSAYEPLRQRRAEFRDRGKGVSGIQLSQGLERYSERGAAYVEEIQGMIRSNGLDELGQPELREVEATRLLDSSDDEGEQ